MNAMKRRAAIAQIIKEQGEADIQSLAAYFDVSPMTIRRDRKLLVEQNILTATYGGAVSPSFLYSEIPYAEKAAVHIEAKNAMALEAIKLIEDDSCILLDAGTSTLALARLLLPRKLSVITVDLQIALLLSQSSTIDIFIPGGQIDKETKGMLDAFALRALEKVNPSFAFIGTNVWDINKGITCGSLAKQQIKLAMMRNATKSILLADASKYGHYSPWEVAPLREFDTIITDSALPLSQQHEINAVGVDIRIARVETNSTGKK